MGGEGGGRGGKASSGLGRRFDSLHGLVDASISPVRLTILIFILNGFKRKEEKGNLCHTLLTNNDIIVTNYLFLTFPSSLFLLSFPPSFLLPLLGIRPCHLFAPKAV